MKNNLHFKMKMVWITLLGLSMLLLSYVGKGQTLVSESFDSGIPASWTSSIISGPKQWEALASSTSPTATPHSGAKMLRYECYNATNGSSSVLISPVLDFTAKSNLKVEFWMYRENGFPTNLDKTEVYVNTSSDYTSGTLLGSIHRSSTQTPTVASNGWYKYTFDIPASFNTATNYVIFRGVSTYGNNIYVDDINIYIPLANDLKANGVSVNPAAIREGDNVTITASVINNGSNNQSNVLVDFKVDGTSIGTQTIASISSGATQTAQKTWVATAGNHTISFELASDDDNANNASSLAVKAYGINAMVENFEGSWLPTGWSIDPSSWNQNTTASDAYNGTKSAKFYLANALTSNTRLISPKVQINGTSSISFYAKRGISDYAEKLQLQYSTDKSAWTNVGTEITLGGSYTNYNVDLSSIPAGNYYIAFQVKSTNTFSWTYKTCHIDYIFGPDLVVEAPNAAVNPNPASASTNILRTPTLSWSAASTGGIPTSYKVYVGTDGGGTSTPTSIVNGSSQTSTSYAITTPLAYNTTYYWQIIPTNSVSDASSCPIWSFTTLPDPTQPIPYSQNFESGTTPTGWSLNSFNIQNFGTAASKSLSVDLSNIATATATTCPVGPLASSTQIVFDYRICVPTYSGYPQQGYSLTASDKIEVMVSENDGVNYVTVYTINQSSHTTATDFAKKYIVLDNSYNGKSILIKVVATTGGGDFQVDVDNLLVRETPTTPSFSINSTAIDFGFNLITKQPLSTLSISNTGGGTLTISEGDITLTGANASDFTIGNATYPISLSAGESKNVEVKFTPASAGVKNATLNIAHNAVGSPATVTLAGESYNAYTSFVEGLETTAEDGTPKGWTITNIGWAYAGVVANATKAHSGTNYVEMSKWSAEYCYFATPAVGNITLNRLKFWAKSSAASTSVSVGTMTDPANPATFTEFQNVALTTAYAQYIVDFSTYAGTNEYLAFKTPAGASNPTLSIDDIVWEANPTTPVLGLGSASLNFGLSVAKTETSMSVQVLNEGVGTLTIQQTDITFTGNNSSEFKLSGSNSFPIDLTKGQVANIQVVFAPTTAGSKLANMVINHNGSNAAGNVTLSGGALPQGSLLENFNATAFPSSGWVAENGWVRQTYSAYEGAGHAYISPTANATNVKLKTPRLNIHPNDSLVFYTKTTATAPFPVMKVMYAENVEGPWTQIGTDITVNNSNYAKQKIDLNSLAGSKYYIAFAVTCNSYKATYLDLVTGPVLYTAPEFKSTPNTSAFVNHNYTYSVVTSDIDADNLTISATTIPSWLTLVDHNNGTATLSGTPTEGGNHNVVIAVSDGSTSIEQSFSINIVNNEAPVFTSTPSLTAKVGHSYSYSVTTSDSENDSRNISIESAPAWLGLTDNGDGTAVLSGTPTVNGDANVTLQLKDGVNTTNQSFTIAVAANGVPQITSTAVTSGKVGDSYSYSITAVDSDNDAITLSAIAKPDWLTLADNGNGTATLSGAPIQAGNYDVTIQVSDGTDNSTQVFAINIEANQVPVFTSTPGVTATTGHNYSYSIATSDSENDARTISVESAPAWLSLTDNGNGTATLTGTPNVTGDANVILQVNDGFNTVKQSFTIAVAANAIPQITSTAVTNGTVGNAYSYSITAADSDNDAITISTTVKPTWLNLTDNGNGTASLSGTPTQVGNYDVTIRVNDGIESSTQVFSINVITTGINDFTIQDIKVYPNPARDIVFINFAGNNVKVTLFDITGKQVKSYNNTTSIDVTSIPSGLYLMRIESNFGLVVKRIEVSR